MRATHLFVFVVRLVLVLKRRCVTVAAAVCRRRLGGTGFGGVALWCVGAMPVVVRAGKRALVLAHHKLLGRAALRRCDLIGVDAVQNLCVGRVRDALHHVRLDVRNERNVLLQQHLLRQARHALLAQHHIGLERRNFVDNQLMRG